MNVYYIFGAVMLLVGLFINYQINRRRFYRRNGAGLQQFKTYSGAVVTTWSERLGKIIGWCLILLSIGMFLSGRELNKRQTEINKQSPTQTIRHRP